MKSAGRSVVGCFRDGVGCRSGGWVLLVGRVGSAPGRNGERWRTHAHAIPSTCSHFHSRRRVQVLSRLPPHKNIVRFFAEISAPIPDQILELLPPLARELAVNPGTRG